MVAWPLHTLIGKSAAAWPIKISSGNAITPETLPDGFDFRPT